MLLDAEKREEGWFRDTVFDVAVCGAGPAGITLALALARKGRRVALLEAGGLDYSDESQECYRGDSVGLHYYLLENARLRFLGGTSNHWTGYSRPLDSRDFAPMAHHPASGWPIGRSDLDPYRSETDSILELPDHQTFPLEVVGASSPFHHVSSYRLSATRFGETYRSELERSEGLSLCLNANLVDILLTEDLRAVAGLQFRSYARPEPFAVRAKQYVLCLGGLENPRALLNADRQIPGGIGNAHDLVGRYFCEHLECGLGSVLLETPIAESKFYWSDDRVMDEKKCLAFQIELMPVPQQESALRRGVDSALCLTGFSQRLGAAIFSTAPVCFDARADVYCQQANNPDSRVYLSQEKDRFGLRRLTLDWRLSELDFHTMRVAAMECAAYLAEEGIGRMRLAAWLQAPAGEAPFPEDFRGAYHHMGTTRMSDDPKTGVVDRHGRVHGVDNLYMGGSSVFPTTGLSNPTYTIVQLALRLGDHLDARLR